MKSKNNVFDSGWIKVDETNQLYYEQSGKSGKTAAVVLHGGPGSSLYPGYRDYFDLDKFRVILYDQRGTGRSIPSIADKSVPSDHFSGVDIEDFVEDLEKLRKALDIENWLVFGGSWGSTLAIAYAQRYPECVKHLVIFGVYLNSPAEMNEYYHLSVFRERFPLYGEKAYHCLAEYARKQGFEIQTYNSKSIVHAYYTMCVLNNDPTAQYKWVAYEDFADNPSPDTFAKLHQQRSIAEISPAARCKAVFESLFFWNAYLKPHDLLFDHLMAKLSDIPVSIVQGEEDTVAPPKFAEEFYSVLLKFNPNAQLFLVTGKHSGSSSREMESKLKQVINQNSPLLSFSSPTLTYAADTTETAYSGDASVEIVQPNRCIAS